jgi:hypothetical protein
VGVAKHRKEVQEGRSTGSDYVDGVFTLYCGMLNLVESILEILAGLKGAIEMSEIPLGFSFNEDEEGFILRTKSADGTVTTIRMSEGELLGFKTQIAFWFDRKMSAIRANSGSVQPIAA